MPELVLIIWMGERDLFLPLPPLGVDNLLQNEIKATRLRPDSKADVFALALLRGSRVGLPRYDTHYSDVRTVPSTRERMSRSFQKPLVNRVDRSASLFF